MDKELKHISKFMSLVLRHRPGQIGLQLDEEGWADVNELIEKINAAGAGLTPGILDTVVTTNDKKRFAFNDDKTRIRASQGHSVSVDLGLEPLIPPPLLYHGTAEKNRDSIFNSGILKGKRTHVHLSADIPTAQQVGSRHGKPVVLVIDAEAMHKAGLPFYLSANGVWLTGFVAPIYILP